MNDMQLAGGHYELSKRKWHAGDSYPKEKWFYLSWNMSNI